MVELIAKTPCAGLLPVVRGTCELREITYGAITSVASFQGHARGVSAALKAAAGVALPSPNRSTKGANARAVWIAHETCLLCSDAAIAVDNAALTDQSDGWAIVELVGADSEDVLARLVPVDLRRAVFKRDHTARTLLGHMTVSVTRSGANTFEIMAFRSMAGTLVHEITVAMESLAARAAV